MNIADEIPHHPTNFIVETNSTQKKLLEREDTDHNFQITIDDTGPKVSYMLLSLEEFGSEQLIRLSRSVQVNLMVFIP